MNPLFLCGPGRSGTTIVTDIIGTHAELSPIYDIGFVASMCLNLNDETWYSNLKTLVEQWCASPRLVLANDGDVFKHGRRHILFEDGYAIDSAAVAQQKIMASKYIPLAYNEMLTSLFDRHALNDNKPYWISKTPAHTQFLPELLNIFPNMKIISCIRDGRDVTSSFMNFNTQMNFSGEPQLWVSYIESIRAFQENNPTQCMEIKYEDFIANTEQVLNSIFEWIGVEQSAATVLDVYGRENIKSSSIGKYKTIFTPEQIAYFNSIAGQKLQELGYEL